MTRSVHDSSPLDLSAYPALTFDGLERRANYRVIAFREDILRMLEKREAAAIIFQIIFRWQDHLRDKVLEAIEQRHSRGLPPPTPSEVEERMWVYMSYARFVRESGGAISYNTVIRTLAYLVDKQVIEQRTNQNPRTSEYADYEYRINRQVVCELLNGLPAFPEHSSKKGNTVQAANTFQPDPSAEAASSPQMGTLFAASSHMGRLSTQTGTPSPLLGTEGSPPGDTIQSILQDTLHESLQQQASDRTDDSQAAATLSSLALSPEEVALILAHRRQAASQATSGPAPAVATTSLDENIPQPTPDDPLAHPESALSAEALVALVERKRGTPYDAQARQRQLVAARMLVALNLPLNLELVERLYDTCYDDWWRAHYGDLHLTHLIEREKHGQLRITRLLARFQASDRRTGRQAMEIPPSEQANGRTPIIGVSGRPVFQPSGQALKVLPPARPARRSLLPSLEV